MVFCERLLCSAKDCCVSEGKLRCVLPLWATVLDGPQQEARKNDFTTSVTTLYEMTFANKLVLKMVT